MRDTYITFHRLPGEDRWKFDGYCFPGQNKNMVPSCRRHIDFRIEQTRKDVERE